MFNSCICGSSLHHGDEGDDYYSDSQSSPKTSKKGNNNNKSNPYADRGLDKFSALLAQIETQKQKIYTQFGADEISIVRFVFSPSSSHSNDVVKPIVVRLKGANKFNSNNKESRTAALARSSGGQSDEDRKNDKDGGRTAAAVKEGGKEKLTKSVSSKKMKWGELRRPRYYVPFTVVMILVFLAIYGRAFAILCTSVGWYAIPAAKEKRPAVTTTVKIRNNNNNNKEYVRRFSEKSLIRRSGDDGSPSPKSGGLTASSGHRHSRKSSL